MRWDRDKMADMPQITVPNVFSWLRIYEFRMKFYWGLFLRVQLKTIQYWFRYWLGADQGTGQYFNHWWLDHRRMHALLSLSELRHVKWLILGHCIWLENKVSMPKLNKVVCPSSKIFIKSCPTILHFFIWFISHVKCVCIIIIFFHKCFIIKSKLPICIINKQYILCFTSYLMH